MANDSTIGVGVFYYCCCFVVAYVVVFGVGVLSWHSVCFVCVFLV